MVKQRKVSPGKFGSPTREVFKGSKGLTGSDIVKGVKIPEKRFGMPPGIQKRALERQAKAKSLRESEAFKEATKLSKSQEGLKESLQKRLQDTLERKRKAEKAAKTDRLGVRERERIRANVANAEAKAIRNILQAVRQRSPLAKKLRGAVSSLLARGERQKARQLLKENRDVFLRKSEVDRFIKETRKAERSQEEAKLDRPIRRKRRQPTTQLSARRTTKGQTKGQRQPTRTERIFRQSLPPGVRRSRPIDVIGRQTFRSIP